MSTENEDDDVGVVPASGGASQNLGDANSDNIESGAPSASPTSGAEARVETPEDRLNRKLAADYVVSRDVVENSPAMSAAESAATDTSAASANNGRDGSAQSAVNNDSASMFEAKAAATATALRKGGGNVSGRDHDSSSRLSQDSVESRPGAYRVRGSSGGLEEDEEESKQEIEYVGARAKLATDATLSNNAEGSENEEHIDEVAGGTNSTRKRASVGSSLKSSTRSNQDVIIPEAFVVEDDKEDDVEMGQEDPPVIPMATATAEVVKTKTVCGINLPTNTWKLLFGAVFGLLALLAIVVGSLAGTGKISGGNTGGATFDAEEARPVVLDCPATKLVADDGETGDAFGRSVSIESGVAIVGAYSHTDEALGAADITFAGAAYVYEKSGDEWTLMTKLLPPDAQVDSKFGVSVAAGRNGNLLAIGADSHNETLGAVYLFIKDKEAQSGWTWSGRIDPPPEERQIGDYFGDFVRIDSDGITLAVGAGDRSTGGLVYMYTLSEADQNGQITWQHDATLRAEKKDVFSDKFGGSLAIRGGTLVVGARKISEFDQASGAAYVFERLNGTWTFQSKLIPPENESGYGYEFGNAVDVDDSGESIVVGSWKSHADDGTIQQLGAAYVFTREGDAWKIQTRLRPDEETREKRRFGSGVAISGDGDTILIGSLQHNDRAGAVFQFFRGDDEWSQVKMIVPPGLYKNDNFGNEIALDDVSGTALVGEEGDTDAGGEKAGAAWLIDMC